MTSWIKNEVKNAKANGVIYGLSGGIDSAVVAVLCKKIFPKNSLALILPCHSIGEDIKDAQELIKKFNINYQVVELSKIYDSFSSLLSGKLKKNVHDDNLARANIKPRLRMISLYYFANSLNYLVVGTSNKSEIMIGYSTKYGDSGADIFPLGNLLKSQVVELAKYLDVTKRIITKPPSAGLWKGQTDEEEMGITYAQLDEYLTSGELNDKKIKKIIETKIELSKHKRNTPNIFQSTN
jgi:NAD+ synthase